MPPGAPASMALPDTMPTTTSFKSSGFATGFRIEPGSCRAPYAALYVTWVPIAPRADRYPRAAASLSLSNTSFATSDFGSRPALSAGVVLDEPTGASETRAPDDGGGV